MPRTLEKVETFLAKHHLLSLATAAESGPHAASLFYAYDPQTVSFIVASDPETEHIENVLNEPHVAGTVALETDEVGKIQGIQFKGVMQRIEGEMGALYFKRFAYAKVMRPTLWQITLTHVKMTDNRLGFGKKLYWARKRSP